MSLWSFSPRNALHYKGNGLAPQDHVNRLAPTLVQETWEGSDRLRRRPSLALTAAVALSPALAHSLAELVAGRLGAPDLAAVFRGYSTGPSRFPGVLRA